MLRTISPPPRRTRQAHPNGEPVKGVGVSFKRYVGLDLSLTNSASAMLQAAKISTDRKSPKNKGTERLSLLRKWLTDYIVDTDPVGVAIEGYSFGSKNGRERMGEWGGVARLVLHDLGVPYIEVPPTSLKKFITSKSAAEKTEMGVQLYKRYGLERNQNDEVDAACLTLFAAAWWEPELMTLAKYQQEAIDKLRKEIADD